MYRKLNAAITRRFPVISGTIFGIALTVWIVSLWLPFVADWLSAHNIFGLIIIAMLVQVLALLDEVIRGPRVETAVGHDQNEDLAKLREFVRDHRPAMADLIEYSSFMVNSLLEELCRQHATIRLLICDPECAINDWQAGRIRATIITLRDITFRNYEQATVRCYRVPASVRGRKLDDLLNLGWYYYGHELYGVQGTATMLTVRTSSTEGRQLEALFNESFDMLWNHPSTRQINLASEKLPE